MPQLQRRINRTTHSELICDANVAAVVSNIKGSQRQGSDQHLLSDVHIYVPPQSVGERRGVGLKCQKNRTVIGKFGLGQLRRIVDRR